MKSRTTLLLLTLALLVALPAAARDRAPERLAPGGTRVESSADPVELLAAARAAAAARDWPTVLDLQEAFTGLADDAPIETRIALTDVFARALDELGRFAEREFALRDLVDLHHAARTPDDTTDRLRRAIDQLAWHVHRLRPDDPESSSLLREALDLARSDPHAGPADLAVQLSHLGNLAATSSDQAGALDWFEQALEAWERSSRPSTSQRAHLLGRLGYAARAVGRTDDAIGFFERQLAIVDESRGAQHPDTLVSLTPLVPLLLDAGRPDDAAALARRGVDVASSAWGADGRRAGALRAQLERAERMRGAARSAPASTTTAAYDGLAPTGDPRLRARARTLEADGAAATGRGEFDLAADFYAEAATIRRDAAAGAESWELARVIRQQAWLDDTRGRAEPARAAYLEAAAMTERVLGATHPLVSEAWHALARFHSGQGDAAAAVEAYATALAVWERAGRESPDAAELRRRLATALRSLARTDEAARVLDESVAAWNRLAGPDAPESARDMTALAGVLVESGSPREAERVVRDVLDRLAPGSPLRVAPLRVAARVLAALERPDDALAALDEALALEREWYEAVPADLAATLRRYAVQFERLGFVGGAAALAAEADALHPGR